MNGCCGTWIAWFLYLCTCCTPSPSHNPRVDYDAIFGDMDVTIPFERYAGKDLIFLGDETKLLEGDAVGGLNSGVMLIRVSDWSQRFFTEVQEAALLWHHDVVVDTYHSNSAVVVVCMFPPLHTPYLSPQQLASYGEKWWDWSDKMETLKTTLKNFAKPLYEQNAVAYFLMRDARYHDKVFLENGEVFVLHTSFDVVPLMVSERGLLLRMHDCQSVFCTMMTVCAVPHAHALSSSPCTESGTGQQPQPVARHSLERVSVLQAANGPKQFSVVLGRVFKALDRGQ